VYLQDFKAGLYFHRRSANCLYVTGTIQSSDFLIQTYAIVIIFTAVN